MAFSGPFFSSKIFAADCRECVKKLNVRSAEAIFKAESAKDFCGCEFYEIAPETVKPYAAKFKNSKFVIFEGCTHSHHLEKTEEYLKTVKEFFQAKEN